MKTFACVILALLLFISCSQQNGPEPVKTNISEYALLPFPNLMVADSSSFFFGEKQKIFLAEGTEKYGELFNSILERNSIQMMQPTTKQNKANIVITLENSDPIPDEGYVLEIKPKQVSLTASSESGIYFGLNTIEQLIIGNDPDQLPLLPTGKIVDDPQYQHRGMMLDVARHFFSVEEVKAVIDYMAMYKMNRLHLHLTDDQGWRIEIKKWPKLTEIGGSKEVDGGEGGFYSQEEYQEIVAYAEERHIVIIPEVDMPGHTNAALASYPELNCDGKARELYTGTRVGFSTLCVQKEVTYEFLNDVIGEIAAISPGPYFHIGGDESDATTKEDYLYFVNKVQDIVASHGKQMVGWDEISQTDINENVVIQHWRHDDFSKLAATKGAKIILSPADRIYLDMKYDETTKLGLAWAGYNSVQDAYDWDPANYIEGLGKEHILGVESPLWSETVTNLDEIEIMTLPRLAGVAELGWSGNRGWEDYKKRLEPQKEIWEQKEIDFYSNW